MSSHRLVFVLWRSPFGHTGIIFTQALVRELCSVPGGQDGTIRSHRLVLVLCRWPGGQIVGALAQVLVAERCTMPGGQVGTTTFTQALV